MTVSGRTACKENQMKVLVASLAVVGLSGCVAYGSVPYGAAYYGNAPYYGSAYYGTTAPYVVEQRPVYIHGPGGRAARRDRDRDGVPDRYDRDRDGDGVPNRDDARPNNPRRY
jgi:hypothetical protein